MGEQDIKELQDLARKEPKLCENGERAHLGQPIVSGACYRGTATKEVTIGYVNAIGDISEKDVIYLCDDCAKLVKRSARRHGNRVKVKPLKVEKIQPY